MRPEFRQKAKDPAYLSMHLAAIDAIRGIRELPWYDAQFLSMFEAAKVYLGHVRPDLVAPFVAAFAPLRTPADFGVRTMPGLFPDNVRRRISETVAGLRSADLAQYEVGRFGRHITHDHPLFVELQRDLTGRVSELTGHEVVPGYNFLSLYGRGAKCPLHLDQPISMYTIDYCIEQSVEWPIHFSRPVEWPDRKQMDGFDAASVKADRGLAFEAHVLRPNDALLFSGSGQWHYREPMPVDGHCHLLFFHYFPKGCENLVLARRWPAHFGWPELEPLCDLLDGVFARNP